MKCCTKCNTLKSLDNFHKSHKSKDGLRTVCKDCRKFYEKKSKTYNAKYYQEHKEEIITQATLYRKNNIEKVQKYQKEYNQKNKESLAIKKKAYATKNKEKINEWHKEYYKIRKVEDPIFKLICNIRRRQNKALKGILKEESTKELLGCTLEELKNHLESKFQTGMSWDNYGKNGWHIDHIKPLSKFDLEDKEQLKKATHYTNLQPLWAIDNLKKGNR